MSKDIQKYNLGIILRNFETELDKQIINLNSQDVEFIKSNIQNYTQNHSYKIILDKALDTI